MLKPNARVDSINGVGEVAKEHLKNLGIETIADLFAWLPRHYIDASKPIAIANVPIGRLVIIEGIVDSVALQSTKNRRISLLNVQIRDETGSLTARWFHQPYLKQKLLPGSKWVFIGTISRYKNQVVMMSPLIEERPTILSVYGQTKGITSKMLRSYVEWVLGHTDLTLLSLPEPILEERNLLPYASVMQMVHKPKDSEEKDVARSQLAFEEVFWFFSRIILARQSLPEEKGFAVDLDMEWLKQVIADLPFELTAGQKRVIWDALQEMETGKPMTRLLNGDVGAGKTVVAAILAAAVARSGLQTTLLAPTEILAKQHQATLSTLLKNSGLKIALWTAAQKDSLDDVDIIIGTHAILQSGFSLPKLGLVIIDEQHRFGVAQRQVLRSGAGTVPHLLSMTATPIPRTLALVIYGDLTVSFLKEKPKNRLPVVTELIRSNEREKMYIKVKEEIDAGSQIFIVCPLIEEKEKKEPEIGEGAQLVLLDSEQEQAQEKKTVIAEVERLRAHYPEFGSIEGIHGKMKAEQKREIMRRMEQGEIQVLVATSVIESGVDVPNASVMIIEGADRFGLAQLHQFRGRVGRGNKQSYCFLCPGQTGKTIDQRLAILVESNDGFVIAETDLELRGHGDLVGKVQAGVPEFQVASVSDTNFLLEVKEIVEEFNQKNPGKLAGYSHLHYSKMQGNLE